MGRSAPLEEEGAGGQQVLTRWLVIAACCVAVVGVSYYLTASSERGADAPREDGATADRDATRHAAASESRLAARNWGHLDPGTPPAAVSGSAPDPVFSELRGTGVTVDNGSVAVDVSASLDLDSDEDEEERLLTLEIEGYGHPEELEQAADALRDREFVSAESLRDSYGAGSYQEGDFVPKEFFEGEIEHVFVDGAGGVPPEIIERAREEK